MAWLSRPGVIFGVNLTERPRVLSLLVRHRSLRGRTAGRLPSQTSEIFSLLDSQPVADPNKLSAFQRDPGIGPRTWREYAASSPEVPFWPNFSIQRRWSSATNFNCIALAVNSHLPARSRTGL